MRNSRLQDRPKRRSATDNVGLVPRSKHLKQVHVILSRNGWAVEKRGASRATRVFTNKNEAIKFAHVLRTHGYDVFVHDEKGNVKDWDRALA